MKTIQIEGIYLLIGAFAAAVAFFGALGSWVAVREGRGRTHKRDLPPVEAGKRN